MKKLLFLLTLTAAVSCNTPQELAVMTLNMRYDNPEDGMNNWRFRRERIAGLIRSEAVDPVSSTPLTLPTSALV